jgi:hypothetical protein
MENTKNNHMELMYVYSRISFIDVDIQAITSETKELLSTYLLSYVDTNTTMCEDLYCVEDWEAVIPENAPGIEGIKALYKACQMHNAAYVRLVTESMYPLNGPGKTLTPDECREMGRIAIVLGNFFGNEVKHRLNKGYTAAVDTLNEWAYEFIDNYGILTPQQVKSTGSSWEQIVIHWGKLRLAKLNTDGI